MLTNDDRKQIVQSFLETVEGISDKDYQRRVWILGKGPEVDDVTETTCHFFEECEPILENYINFGITNNQYNLLIKFRDEFRKFSKKHDLPFDFLDTVEWTKITVMAQAVLQAFNYQKNKTFDRENYKNYVREVACLLKDNAKKAKIDADHPPQGDSADFNSGFLMAYHQVISIMKNQAPFFELLPKDINLADIEPERDLI